MKDSVTALYRKYVDEATDLDAVHVDIDIQKEYRLVTRCMK